MRHVVLLFSVAVAPTLIGLTNTVIGPPALWPLTTVDLPLWVAVVCLYVGFHHDAPTPPAVPWLRAQAVAIGLGMVWMAVAMLVGSAPWTWVTIDNTGAVMNWIMVAAGLVVLLLAPRHGPTFHAWAGGLAICAATSLPLQADSVWFAGQLHSQGTIGIAPLMWACAQVALLVAITTASNSGIPRVASGVTTAGPFLTTAASSPSGHRPSTNGDRTHAHGSPLCQEAIEAVVLS